MDEHNILNLSPQQVRTILDSDETFWPGYEEWLNEMNELQGQAYEQVEEVV